MMPTSSATARHLGAANMVRRSGTLSVWNPSIPRHSAEHQAWKLGLGCYGDNTILVLPAAVISYKVTAIDYRRSTLTLAPRVDYSSPSCKQKLMSMSLPASIINCEDPDPCSLLCRNGYATIVSCLREFIPSNLAANFISGPISCLSSTSQFSYLVAGYASMSVLPLDCKVVPDSYFLMATATAPTTLKEQAETILDFSGTTTIGWYGGVDATIAYNCTQCERGGGRCGFSPDRNQTICMNQGIISNWSDPIIHYESLQILIRFFETS